MSCVRQPKFSEDMANTLKLIEATSTDGAVIAENLRGGRLWRCAGAGDRRKKRLLAFGQRHLNYGVLFVLRADCALNPLACSEGREMDLIEVFDVCLFFELLKDGQGKLMRALVGEWLYTAPDDRAFARRLVALDELNCCCPSQGAALAA
jgi:hypothetical protein